VNQNPPAAKLIRDSRSTMTGKINLQKENGIQEKRNVEITVISFTTERRCRRLAEFDIVIVMLSGTNLPPDSVKRLT